jgi:UPF0755 protein
LNLKKIVTLTSVALISVLIVYGFVLMYQIFSDNTKFTEKELYVYVPTGSSYEQVKQIITPYIKDISRFEVVAEKRDYPENVKAGRFLL